MAKKKTDKPEKQPEHTAKQHDELQRRLEETTADLQRVRADFENYRKRTEADLGRARGAGQADSIKKLLPVIDNIERAIGYVPDRLKDDAWAQGVTGLTKNLDKSLAALDVKRITAAPGEAFDPELHEAISSDDSDGDHEVIAEELQAGYLLGGRVIRHSMVKVTRQYGAS